MLDRGTLDGRYGRARVGQRTFGGSGEALCVNPSLPVDGTNDIRSHPSVLLGPVMALAPAGVNGMVERAKKVHAGGMSSIVDEIIEKATSADTKLNNPRAVRLIRELITETSPAGYAQACMSLAGVSLDPDLRSVKGKTMILGGHEDYMSTQEVIARIVKGLPDASTILPLEKVGHWLALESPDRVGCLMGDFFAIGDEQVDKSIG